MTEAVNAHLTADLAKLPTAERALVVGGTESESGWLTARGWNVTTVDPSAWSPGPEQYGLVANFYAPVAGSSEDFVDRLADAVDPGGTLYIVGHLAPGQIQVSSDDAIAALSDDPWDIHIAEERDRATGDGVDSIFRAEKSGSF